MGTPDYSGWNDVTDQYVPPDTSTADSSPDYSKWNDVTDSYAKKKEDSPGYYDTTIAALQKGLHDLESSVGGVAQTVGENIGSSKDNSFLGNVGQEFQDFGGDIRDDAKPWQLGAQQTLDRVPQGSWKKTYANVTEGMANALPQLVAGGGSLPVTIGYNALNRFGTTRNNTQDELEARGVPADQATQQAEGNAAVSSLENIPLDALFMSPLFNQGTGPIRKTVESTLSTMAGAFPQKAADLEARYLSGVDQTAPTAKKVFDNAGETLLESGLSGAVMGAGMSMLPHAEATGDYFSNRSSKEGVLNWESKLNQNVVEKQVQGAQEKALAEAEMVAQGAPQGQTSTQIPDIINPEGDARQNRIEAIRQAQRGSPSGEVDPSIAENELFGRTSEGYNKNKSIDLTPHQRGFDLVQGPQPSSASQEEPAIAKQDSVKMLPAPAEKELSADTMAPMKPMSSGMEPMNMPPMSPGMEPMKPLSAPETKTVTKVEPIKQPLTEDGGSVKISTTVPKEQPKPVDAGALNAVPVQEVPVDKIEHFPEIPNMKRNAKGKGGTVPGKELAGDFSRLPANPITVLEASDGKMGVVTGRHRLAKAIDSNEKTIPAQVVRETDGYTKEWARMFDAEQNIRDGQGNTDDYANYFRQAQLLPQEAQSRGLTRDEKGQQGYAIGTNASQEVYDGYMNGILSSKQAASIASAAPQNPDLQRAGIKLAMSGTNADQLPNAIKQLQMMSATQQGSQGQQTDMFGADDRVMKMVIDQSNAAAAKIKEIDQEIYASRGAVKNPDAARKGGVVVEDAKATQAHIDQLKQEKGRWQNWVNDPELRGQLTQEFTTPDITHDSTVAAQKFDIIPDEQTGLFQLDNSADAFPDPIRKPFSEPPPDLVVKTQPTSKSIKESPLSDQSTSGKLKSKLLNQSGAIRIDLPNFFRHDGFGDFIKRMKGEGIEQNPEFYNFFDNKRSKLYQAFKGNLLASTFTKAERFPWYRKSHDAALKNFEMENSLSWDHDALLRPFTLLNAKEKQNVSTLLYAGLRKGPSFDASSENLTKLGLSDREIRGVGAMRNTMDSALETLRGLQLDKINRSQVSDQIKAKQTDQVNQHFDEMKASNFVPTGRYGKYGLTLYDTKGKVVQFNMNDSKAKLANALYEAIRKDPSIDPVKSRVAPVAKALGSEYVGAHPDIIDVMQDKGAQIPSASFENRFKKRELIEGFESDLQRNAASYLSSFARYVSTQRTKMEFADHNKAFDAFYQTLGNRDRTLYTGLRRNIDDLQKWILQPKNSSSMSKFLAGFYLADAFKTAAVNTTSFFNSSYPKIAKYTQGLKNIAGVPERIWAKSNAEALQYYGKKGITGIEGGKVGEDLWASLEAARKEGIVGGNRVMKDLLTNANRPSASGRIGAVGQKVSAMDLAYMLNGATEDWVRTHAYITGWNTHPYAEGFFQKQSARNNEKSNYNNGEGNISLPDRHTFAKNFVRETQADYTPAGAPDFTRNWAGKLASTFRLYHHAYFTSLKNSLVEKQFGAASRYIGALVALGGVMAIPVAGSLIKTAKIAGFNTDDTMKDALEYFGITKPRTQQMILNGIPTNPHLGNVNISGAISPDIIPEEAGKGDIVGGLGKFFLGVAADPIDRIGRAWYYHKEKGDDPRALEQLYPPAFNIQTNITANRWQKEGVRNAGGEDILGRPPTDTEIMMKRLGFTPQTIAMAMDEDLAKKRAAVSGKDNDNINEKIARAYALGSDEDVKYWMNYATQKGIKFNPGSIVTKYKEMESPDRADFNRFGRHNLGTLEKLNSEYEDLINPKD